MGSGGVDLIYGVKMKELRIHKNGKYASPDDDSLLEVYVLPGGLIEAEFDDIIGISVGTHWRNDGANKISDRALIRAKEKWDKLLKKGTIRCKTKPKLYQCAFCD